MSSLFLFNLCWLNSRVRTEKWTVCSIEIFSYWIFFFVETQTSSDNPALDVCGHDIVPERRGHNVTPWATCGIHGYSTQHHVIANTTILLAQTLGVVFLLLWLAGDQIPDGYKSIVSVYYCKFLSFDWFWGQHLWCPFIWMWHSFSQSSDPYNMLTWIIAGFTHCNILHLHCHSVSVGINPAFFHSNVLLLGHPWSPQPSGISACRPSIAFPVPGVTSLDRLCRCARLLSYPGHTANVMSDKINRLKIGVAWHTPSGA